MVDDGVAYAAAGIASWDGTHVYALDAATGKIRWQNNTSGRLAGRDKVSGASVQGHLLLHDDRLYLAGGNVVSPAVYDTTDGRCLNTLDDEFVRAPRGSELVLMGNNVAVFGGLLYSPREYHLGPFRLPYLIQATSDDVLIRTTGVGVARLDPATQAAKKPQAVWASNHIKHPIAIALASNAVVVAGQLSDDSHAVAALNLPDGRLLWTHPLPTMPATSGLALDAAGRVTLTLRDGRLLSLAPPVQPKQ